MESSSLSGSALTNAAGRTEEARRSEGMKYVVVSPVRDEERYVERTLVSMIQQQVKPVRWIIVDDGSSDRTPEVLARYAKKQGFIQIVRREVAGTRQPGSPVVRAFEVGYDAARNLEYEFIAKLDCDLSFGPDYFEGLLTKMQEDPGLGIASGVYMEASDEGTWVEVPMPPYHAAGASKMMRRRCFEEIGGFVPARGWDTVDEIRAMARGWRTKHFRELKMKHWKPEGTGIGPMRTHFMHGEVYYLTGGSKLFFLFKVLHRMGSRPLLFGSLALLWGYVRTMASARPRLVTSEEVRCYRALLNRRILGQLKGGVSHNLSDT